MKNSSGGLSGILTLLGVCFVTGLIGAGQAVGDASQARREAVADSIETHDRIKATLDSMDKAFKPFHDTIKATNIATERATDAYKELVPDGVVLTPERVAKADRVFDRTYKRVFDSALTALAKPRI